MNIPLYIFQVISAAMIAYALTQFKFKEKKVLFAIIMGTYIPCYMILVDINLIDTLTGLRQFFIQGGAYGIKWPVHLQ